MVEGGERGRVSKAENPGKRCGAGSLSLLPLAFHFSLFNNSHNAVVKFKMILTLALVLEIIPIPPPFAVVCPTSILLTS